MTPNTKMLAHLGQLQSEAQATRHLSRQTAAQVLERAKALLAAGKHEEAQRVAGEYFEGRNHGIELD